MQLELGGKDPVYVCDDADAGAAAEPGRRRLLQHRPELLLGRAHLRPRAIPDAFVDAFVADGRRASWSATRWTDDTYIGPLTRAPQLDVLEAQVEDAVAKGARCARRAALGRARATGSRRPCSPTSTTAWS